MSHRWGWSGGDGGGRWKEHRTRAQQTQAAAQRMKSSHQGALRSDGITAIQLPRNEQVNTVQLDGLVVLKIIKHCRDNIPRTVSGHLLGLDVGETLEVTHSFPLPTQTESEHKKDSSAGLTYQAKMMKNLSVVNIDNNSVGWYQSVFGGDMLHADASGVDKWNIIVQTQFEYQRNIPNSVVVVYDPYRTSHGSLALKAYRLSEDFMAMYVGKDLSRESFETFNVSSATIFEELKVKLHNSHLVHAFLYELRESRFVDCEADRLQLTGDTSKRDLKFLGLAVKEYQQEQARYQYYLRMVARRKMQTEQFLQKRKNENVERIARGEKPLSDEDLSKHPLFKPIQAPSRLESFMITHQLRQFCDQLRDSVKAEICKHYVHEGFYVESRESNSGESN